MILSYLDFYALLPTWCFYQPHCPSNSSLCWLSPGLINAETRERHILIPPVLITRRAYVIRTRNNTQLLERKFRQTSPLAWFLCRQFRLVRFSLVCFLHVVFREVPILIPTSRNDTSREFLYKFRLRSWASALPGNPQNIFRQGYNIKLICWVRSLLPLPNWKKSRYGSWYITRCSVSVILLFLRLKIILEDDVRWDLTWKSCSKVIQDASYQ